MRTRTGAIRLTDSTRMTTRRTRTRLLLPLLLSLSLQLSASSDSPTPVSASLRGGFAARSLGEAEAEAAAKETVAAAAQEEAARLAGAAVAATEEAGAQDTTAAAAAAEAEAVAKATEEATATAEVQEQGKTATEAAPAAVAPATEEAHETLDSDDAAGLEEESSDDDIELDAEDRVETRDANAVAVPNGGFQVADENVGEIASNVSSLWGIWWGSCRNYGCASRFVPGQLCHCWPGCVRLSLCCSDYYSVCHAPPPPPDNRRRRHWHHHAPAPHHPHHPHRPHPAPTPAPAPSPSPSDGQLHTFYMYRSQNHDTYPPKNVNTANLAGVIWYLQHEVVITDPPKFGIYRILRYKVQTKAPAKLLQSGMNFGVRYAYDSQDCTGPGDCNAMYGKYGNFVGCNNFESGYPYPTEPTHFRGGIWYSIPGQGTCNGPPTGAFDCTFSYDWPPAEITLEELQGEAGRSFWDNPDDSGANERKVQAARRLFQQKYPDTEDLADPPCDFNFDRFWQSR